jgi:HAMP domain-containing protein
MIQTVRGAGYILRVPNYPPPDGEFSTRSLYLALFAASTVALGVFVYWSIRREILADFDEAIVEERGALQHIFAKDGRDRLVGGLDAGVASGGHLAAGLWGPDGRRLGGDLALPPSSLPPKGGWFDAAEAEADEAPESEPETLRALGTPLPDGSTLVVANERRRSDETLRRVMTAFAWALGGTIALGAAGGLWLSAQFLRRIDVMRRAARGIMAGDWSRRIPLASVDDDLSALARTFNRLFDRIETLLLPVLLRGARQDPRRGGGKSKEGFLRRSSSHELDDPRGSLPGAARPS